jgi:general secretion pathway protein A
MYAEFYGLRELPFNITPDPRFLYLNDCYQEALAALSYGIDARKGFISLVGEAGTGKTTLLRRLLDSVSATTRTVLLVNPSVSFDEILEHILLELGVPPAGGRKLALLQRLNEFLLEHTRAGGNVVLLIDEAQDLSPAVLEELRLLSNLETASEKILQIVLAGQPELERMLAEPRLRQLRQRVTLRVRLRPLSYGEVAAYVRSRLERAGASTPDVFTTTALARVGQLTNGIPRVVNVLCDAALLTAFAAGSRQVTPAIVEEAWRDYAADGTPEPSPEIETALFTVPPPVETRSIPPQVVAEQVPAPAAPPIELARPEREPALPADDQITGSPEDDALGPAPLAPAPVLSGPPFGLPVAAAGIAVLAVMLSLVSLLQHRVTGDGDRPGPVAQAAPAALAGPIEATAAEPPVATQPVPAAETLTPEEATALVDEFRAAYEARDVDRLLRLFAPDASSNGMHGIDAIGFVYRASLASLTDVRYSMPRFSIEARGTSADVRAPFVVSYRTDDGTSREIHGQAEWELARRGGEARIVTLNYRIDPES